MDSLLVLALLVLLVAFGRRIHRLRRELDAERLAASRAARSGAERDLMVLRLEIGRRAGSGELDEHRAAGFLEAIEQQWAAMVEREGPVPGDPEWERRARAAWQALAAHGRVPIGPPPWRAGSPPAPAPGLPAAPALPVAPEPRPAVLERPGEPLRQRSPAAVAPLAPEPGAAREAAEPEPEFAWEPAAPGPVERALRAVAGWPRAVLPFLAQNIGWFIGGFLFLAGSVFLVTYTTGFAKGVVVFVAVFAYTLALLWGGYRLRRSEVRAGGATLMILGMLLVPLNLSAAVRLLLGGDAWWMQACGLVASAVSLGVFLFAAQVVSGVVDRSLQGAHPRLFLALAAVQLVVPPLARWPSWPLLAGAHLGLLGLLGYGLLRYTREWMRAIFLERRPVAFFAAGTLLYAAVVSFVHVTWGAAALQVPPGYYAPYLMAACGLLFHVDAELKAWAERHVYLSRLSFLIYGLSVVAVLLSLSAPLARLITLVLAAVLYGALAWRNLTLPPLALLLASLFTLYGYQVLAPLPAGWHLLAALPGLGLMLALSRWTRGLAERRRGAYRLSLFVHRAAMLLLLGLGTWSLVNAGPGLLGMASALLLAAGTWWGLRAATGPLLGALPAEPPRALDLTRGPWLYVFVLALSAAGAWAPPWPGLPPGLQLGLTGVLLGGLWTALALAARTGGRLEVYANAALLAGAGGIAAVAMSVPQQPLWLALAGAGTAASLLALAVGLYLRWLFYGFLAVLALAAAMLKLALFPAPGTGVAQLLAGLVIWAILRRLDLQPEEIGALRRARAPRPITLLWLFPARAGD